jgi:hypothetical protein
MQVFAPGTTMNRSEFEKTLREFPDRRPFQPFVIALIDGDELLVPDRQAINYLTGESALLFDADENMRFVDCDAV